jgi:flagellar hook protein FlgE
MSFQQALSGLNAASKSLDAIGNNVANSSTVGFKSSQVQFADVFASSLSGGSGTQVGIGTTVQAVVQQFSQGNITVTSNPLDIAINGGGFFRMSQGGATTFARNGQFQLDKDGYIVNSQGLHLTGYPASSGAIQQGSLTDLQISSKDVAPKATSTSNVVLNLDSRDGQPASGTFNINDSTSYNFSTSQGLYDSLGNSHVLSMYFVKTATSGQWELHAAMDGVDPAGAITIGGAAPPFVLDFDTSGKLTTSMTPPPTVSVDLAAIAAAQTPPQTNSSVTPMDFALDFTGSNQFGASFGVTSLSQDGYTSGRLSGFNVGADGIIQGRYTNGQSQQLGQIVLVNFANPQGLQSLGNNQWGDTPASGGPVVGAPNSGSLGVLQSAAVEDSNVDLTAELVNMITAQRVYQANAQTIKTQDQVLQTLVNLR